MKGRLWKRSTAGLFFSCCLQSHNLNYKRLRPQKISPRRILHVTKITPGRNLFAVGQPLQSSAAVADSADSLNELPSDG